MTPGFNAEPAVVTQLLNVALALEIVCVLRYRRHVFTAEAIGSESLRTEVLKQAKEEQAHANQLAQRIVQLGGVPNVCSEGLLSRTDNECGEGHSFPDLIDEDLIAERLVMEGYREMILYIGNDDHRTRRLLEHVLANDKKHMEGLACLLARLKVPARTPSMVCLPHADYVPPANNALTLQLRRQPSEKKDGMNGWRLLCIPVIYAA